MTYPPGNPHQPFGYGPDAATVAFNAAQKKSRRRLTIVLSAIVAILVLVVGLGAVKLYQDKTGNILIPALSLRSANDPGPDPFTPSVTLTNRTVPANTTPRGDVDRGVRAVNGTTPGLYATAGTAACDTAALGNSLAGDPAAGDAWASVFGIRRGDIPWYLNTLTPVVLTADTWVTNHSYRGGVAHPFQSVLQAGTSVYVDGAGVPRAVCSCGNPLLPPAAAPVGGYRVVGHPWPAYRTTHVERVSYTTNNTTNNTTNTTIVNTPAPLTSLNVLDLVRGANVALEVGNLLENLGPAPAGMNLPDPIQANAAPRFVGTAAADNGLKENSTEPEDAVVAQAEENGGTPVVEALEPNGSEQNGSEESGSVPNSSDSNGSSTAPSGSSESSAAPTPTDFGTTTGDAIGTLTFDSAGDSVTCTLPSTFASTQVDADCTDGSTRTFNASDLTTTAVSDVVNASSDRVWTVTTTSNETLTVTEATWQTLVPETTTTTTTPETTTEEPTTTEEETTTTTEETTTTDEPAPETTTAVPEASATE